MSGASSENTGSHQKPQLFKPGQSGNPSGRPKGSRNKLGEDFIKALHKDFSEHGEEVISAVRAEKPDQYLKVIAAVVPKEIELGENLADLVTGITRKVIGE